MCTSLGLDLARDPIPVGPAAHYIMGGVETDVWGRTSMPALFAAGEVACTGVHGANRLASNSLLEGLVFGARAAAAMQQSTVDWLEGRANWSLAPDKSDHQPSVTGRRVPATSHEPPVSSHDIRDLMWRSVGLFRSRAGLEEAADRLDAAAASIGGDSERGPIRSLVTVARLIAGAALRREESRGAHFREDFPARDDLHWQRHLMDLK